MAYARERAGGGDGVETAAIELGVGVLTLERWLRDSSSCFGAIELVPPSRSDRIEGDRVCGGVCGHGRDIESPAWIWTAWCGCSRCWDEEGGG